MEDRSVIEETKERQQAEIEFVQAAYENDEAWCDDGNDDDGPTIGRRLRLASTAPPNECIDLVMELVMPPLYPVQQGLEVSAKPC